jgi:hypothetical protein
LSSGTREALFYLRHSKIAEAIGTVQHGALNISTNAVRFATALHLQENPEHEGSQVNAFRHALWQATITARFGPGIAAWVGMSHENNPFALEGVNDPAELNFESLSEADQAADLANNMIGRRIGAAYPQASMRQLAGLVAEEFYDRGLWTASQFETGPINVSRTTLSEWQVREVLQRLDGLNENGFTPAQEAARAAELRDTARAFPWGVSPGL